jgi:hypothetical protein
MRTGRLLEQHASCGGRHLGEAKAGDDADGLTTAD